MWSPNEKDIKDSNLYQFITYLNDKLSLNLNDYQSLYQFSIDNIEGFWSNLASFYQVSFLSPAKTILESNHKAMKDSRWFLGASLNYAWHCLNHPKDKKAITSIKENGEKKTLTFGQLEEEVKKAYFGLKKLGVKKGDRIAAIMPNTHQTVIMMLATSALGGIWSSCSPDFGTAALIDRLSQIKPCLLFSVDGYFYKGKTIDIQEKIKTVGNEIDSIKNIIIADYANIKPMSFEEKFKDYANFLEDSDLSIEYEPCEFDAPFAILFSSGTTGKPKCIVHGVGGTLLQHVKELGLHTNLSAKDSLFYYTTCGWMMWNWSVSALLLGASIILFDGAPTTPNVGRLFDIIDEEKVSVFGTSAKYLLAIEKEGLIPNQSHALKQLKTILSTGSPLAPRSFDYVYKSIKKNVLLSSISGGTDIISCFALGCPIKPVIRGELQCIGLGMNVAILDNNQKLPLNQTGELACLSPFPSRPIFFYGDKTGEKYKNAYFSKDNNIWLHGDYAKITPNGGLIILGRSDAILNPGGVRIGTAEIYRQVEKIPEVIDSVVVGQNYDDDVRVILFVKLKPQQKLDEDLIIKIKKMIRENTTARHVPQIILQVSDIPKTISGKVVELAVKNIIEGKAIDNIGAIANPSCLNDFKDRQELRS